MKYIGVISDTHGHLESRIIEDYLKDCDEIWHAGDIGNLTVFDTLSQKAKMLRIVSGNIDDHILKRITPEYQIFDIEEHRIFIIHIAGKFGSYNPIVRALIEKEKPTILVCGHAHILKVAFDKKFNLLYINPGACGLHGFQKIRTILRFKLEGKRLTELQVIELNSK